MISLLRRIKHIWKLFWRQNRVYGGGAYPLAEPGYSDKILSRIYKTDYLPIMENSDYELDPCERCEKRDECLVYKGNRE